MKNMKYLWLSCLAIVAGGFLTACDDDDDNDSTPITVNAVYLQDVDSSVPDREVDFARLGQLVRIEGSGFKGLKKIYVNGYDTYFNNALMTDLNVWVTLDSDTPIDKAEESVRNTIRFVKNGTETTYSFTIRAASPSVSSVNNTLPMAGETVVVYGTNLQETTQLTLPGGVIVTDIESDDDGEWYSFVMPEGCTESGCILSEGANGSASTPAYFNESGGMILNFDGTGDMGSWSATYGSDDLATDPLGTGRGTVVPAVPASVVADGGIKAGAHGSGWFTAGNDSDLDDWSRFYTLIPATTSVSDISLQFDVYVPEEWSTGMLEFTLQNNLSTYGYGSTETQNTTNITYPTAVVWVPWLVDGEVVPFSTTGWETITIPISDFGKYQDTDAGYTFSTVVEDRNAGSYRNFGMFLVNSDVEYSDDVTFEATTFAQMVYVDNWRIVPSASVTISDFDD